MAEIRITFAQNLEGGALSVLARVRPFGWAGKSRSVVVPVGAEGRSASLTLDPGRYLIEAVMPSGNTVSRVHDVSNSPDPQEIKLSIEELHEPYLGWQQMAGNMPPTRRLFETTKKRLLSSPVETLILREAFEPRPWSDVSTMVEGRLALRDRGPFLADLRKVLGDRVSIEDHPARYRKSGSLQSWIFDDDPAHPLGPMKHRRWIGAQVGAKALIAVLPYPWTHAGGGDDSPVDVVLMPEAGEEEGIRMACTIHDPMLGTVLSYLGQGNLPAAGEVLSAATGMLFEKMLNPLGAAAGAYVLIQNWILRRQETNPPWRSWVQTLMHQFPWLPDGAILHGCLALKGQVRPDVGEARIALLEGLSRGIPFFTAGTRLLRDGLALLSGDAQVEKRSDPELEDAFRRASRISRRVDIRQPFTVLDMS